jgi:hypothetical protein
VTEFGEVRPQYFGVVPGVSPDLLYQIRANFSNFPISPPESTFFVRTGINTNERPDSNDPLGSPFTLRFDEVMTFNYSLDRNSSTIWMSRVGRMEDIHLGPWILSLSTYIILGVMCIIFHNFQPLKSRGIIPVLATICHINMLFNGIGTFLTIDVFRLLRQQLYTFGAFGHSLHRYWLFSTSNF